MRHRSPARPLTRLVTGLAGAAAVLAAVGEGAGASTRFVRIALWLAAGGAALVLAAPIRGGRRPAPPLALFGGAATAALALHYGTYLAAPVGTVGLVADVAYWSALVLSALLGAWVGTFTEP
jgi:acetyl-CoA acetyltransferase